MRSILFVAIIMGAGSLAYGETGATQEITRLPAVTVEGTLKEETPVGPYQQPEWTTARRFTTTRVYLQQQPWEVGVEQWVKAQWPRGEAGNYLFQEEIELGLPHRFQLDLYENWRQDVKGHTVEDSVSLEGRWALADWGKLWGNPTLYGEWVFSNHSLGPDRFELKLLLGDELMPRVHWGLNVIGEQEIDAPHTTELGVSGGLSYSLIDEKLGLGIEAKVESETASGGRTPVPVEVDLGPSFQWRPVPNFHIDAVPLFGVTSDSPRVEAWFIVGYDFGARDEKSSWAPVSLRSH